ncbi:ATP-binding cassette-type vacuolar membrane transporter Hmt1 [Purpureocillium takamizusanense]|uniref:ATP-binding cassette-type vacuolar membrane transporter Hmt1 n=1 Tax=Purpureocillium takamizusanense TaxID=2060973 RepID=A0A9Q8VCA3_9HYPO|nr:ATP-binding cassette-type vacuolar membrane transporter Hmt1 [Purpureocillium takamizusanense]UNI21410.1 ATP-binding cassette-type vacuolar membrane transporter Hmt1 [Purpureocillium takamizusanense]
MAADHEKPPPQRLGSNNDRSSAVDVVLRETQYFYAVVLLAAFIGCAAWYSVYNAKKDEDLVQPLVKGPGGKPLPITKRKKRDNGERKIGPRFGRAAKNVFRYLGGVIFLAYVASGASTFIHAFYHEDPYQWSRNGLPWAGEWTVVHLTGATFFYLYILFSLFDWRKGPNIVHLVIWILGLTGEIVLSTSTFIAAADCHFARSARGLDSKGDSSCVDYWTKVDLILYFVRILHLLLCISLYCAAWIFKVRRGDESLEEGQATESTPLLLNGSATHASYDTQNGHAQNGRVEHVADGRIDRRRSRSRSNANKPTGKSRQGKDEPAAFYRPEKLPHRTWWEYMRGYSLFFPYLWPKDSFILRLHVLVCFGLVILQRLVNMTVPTQIGRVVDKLDAVINDVKRGEPLTVENFPLWDFVLLGLLWIMQGQSGLLGSLRSLLWIPVSQYSYRGLTTAAFNHVHSLSLDFHLSKRTGEVLSALNKGSAINQFLEQVTFQVVPMLFDLFLSIYVFYHYYGAFYAEINLVDTCWYLYMTIKMASTRADQRREMTNADREEEAVKNDSISSYETVKYFNAEDFESRRYQDRVGVFQTAEAKVQMGMVMMNICQTLVFNLGRIIAAMVCGWQVAVGVRTPGNWFMIVSYLTQLQGPLNFFGTFYRTVQQAMISGERLLELFKIQPTVVDTPHAEPLTNFQGHIRWNNVSFAYDRRKPALRNVSFECAPGTTTAFVGESGGGKSTLFRHMFRYYDCDEGSIELDGKDVKDLTINSVRQHIGVVPQDTTLFNESLMYNLKYANPGASDEDVHQACIAASIHERIMSFPDKYETQVGERGMRLSGGEKQRVAIARTILKDPRIIMLDEATSALDTHTEQEIQDNVWKIGKGRTLLVIAHRLSTITHADQIIVLHAGAVVERGTHEELLAAQGRYASMWEKQIRAEKALDKAREATVKAAKALKRANMAAKKNAAEVHGDDYHTLGSSGTLSDNETSKSKGDEESSSSSSGTSASSSDAESTHDDDHSSEHGFDDATMYNGRRPEPRNLGV